eukprot:Transcript_5828.p1 GENE.Transcript_5828~~Transcript_5828.p1  ORF type:complete len:386 (+),score=155.20 Transcript_5828:689-1846(+)
MRAPPQGFGAVLIKVELHMHRSLMGAHLMCPPFDAAAVATSDAHTGGDALPPEALHLARARVARACLAPPALLEACYTSPLLGLLLLLPAGWLLYGMTPAAFPWWLMLMWAANGVARHRARARAVPNPWEPTGDGSAAAVVAHPAASASEKLGGLHRAARPLVASATALAVALEKLAEAPSAADPLGMLLAVVPALACAALASAALGLCGGVLWLVGGAPNLLMLCCAVAALANLVRHYQAAIVAWTGAGLDGPAASPASIKGRARDPEADTAGLLPPGAKEAHGDDELPDGPMSPEKAVAGIIEGGRRLGAAWDETSAKAAELAAKPTAQRMIRATSSIATNLWRRLPDSLEVTHRAIAFAAIRPEEEAASLPAPKGGLDEFSA